MMGMQARARLVLWFALRYLPEDGANCIPRITAMARNSPYRTAFHIRKGSFHRWLGKSEGSPITAEDIAKGKAAGGHPEKMAQFAENAKKFHH